MTPQPTHQCHSQEPVDFADLPSILRMWLMFNLSEDPYEMANLVEVAKLAPIRAALQERLRRWICDTGDDFPLPAL